LQIVAENHTWHECELSIETIGLQRPLYYKGRQPLQFVVQCLFDAY
jgi:hypothetical protein